MKKTRFLILGLLSASAIMVSAYSSSQVVDVSACQKIDDRLARYACYDGVDTAGTVAPQRPAPAATSSSREEAEEESGSILGRLFDRDEPEEQAQTVSEAGSQDEASAGVDGFGRSSESNARLLEGVGGKTELTDTVAALEQLGPQMWQITLESGQQWRQMLSKRYLLKVGDEVRIYPTRWGSSYRLSATRMDGFIQVERVD